MRHQTDLAGTSARLPQMGDKNDHRSWVGTSDYFDRLGAVQFLMLVQLGMRETHKLLDIGCGSLRGGRFSLLYLNKGCYHGIEPETWCLDQGIAHEIGQDMMRIKEPRFNDSRNFDAGSFDTEFDYVMAAGIFMHTAPHQVEGCFLEMQRVLSAKGLMVGAFIEGCEDSTDAEWTYPHIQQYRPETIIETARKTGLTLQILDAPHPLNHKWFAAWQSTTDACDAPGINMQAFTWTEYLQTQLKRRGGTPLDHETYLRRDLSEIVDPGDYSVVPQARL